MKHFFECKNLSKDFGGLTAVNQFNFHMKQAEIVSIIGPNGAGKTTFFNLITGLYPVTSGEITFNGHNIVGLSPYQITELGIARTFQAVRLFTDMTILENAMIGQHCRTNSGVIGAILQSSDHIKEEEHIKQYAKNQLEFFGSRLSGYRMNQPASVLSYANRRRLEIARAMSTEAQLLLLDEPAAGMNPKETIEIANLIGRLRDERGFSILVIEHDMQVVKDVSDHVIAMDYGGKIAEGDYYTVANDDRVIEAYLGRSDN